MSCCVYYFYGLNSGTSAVVSINGTHLRRENPLKEISWSEGTKIGMDICRVCLAANTAKNVFDPQPKRINKSLTEIFSFCLDIEVTEDSKVSTMLCIKCYRKLLNFNKFKVLAQKNDAHLKSLVANPIVKLETFSLEEEEEVFNNNDIIEKNEFDSDVQLAPNVFSETVKLELEDIPDVQDSDDEILSVIKKIKNNEQESCYKVLKQDLVKKDKRKRKKEIKKKEVCDECGKAVRDLKAHIVQHQALKERKVFKCNLCDQIFKSPNARYKHIKYKHMGMKEHCDICNRDIVNMWHHRIMYHAPERLKHECALCGRKFISKSKYEEHMTLHTKDKPFKCPDCNKRFRLKNSMLLHGRQVHLQEKSHLCQFCSKSFFKKYHLQLHIRSHTKEKPYECPDCGKVFSTSSVLKNHRLTHDTERKHQCSHCDAKFVNIRYLRAHLVTHSGERRYPCQYCGVGFRRSDHRKRHEFTAHQKHMPDILTGTSRV